MKISEKPTDNILVTAKTDSEWDNCNFAIISGGKAWAAWLQPRLEAAQTMQKMDDFCSLKFFDANVGFYISNDEEIEEILEELEEKSWAFVELENGEEEQFSVPESSLDCHVLTLFLNGHGRYIAYGEHTNEDFSTAEISFADILSQYTGSDAG